MDKKNCGKCNQGEAFACDSCKKFLCAQCAELTASEAKCLQLKGKRRLIFLCSDCEGGFWKVPVLIKEVNELKEQICALKEQLNEYISKSKQNSETPVIPVSTTQNNVTEICEELHERQVRASNVIIMNINESKMENQKARIEEDTMRVKEVIESTGIVVENIKIYRLGKYTEERTRPIKVILPDPNIAFTILKNRSKVKNVLIFSDKTKLQQNYYKQIKNKVNEINQNGGNKMIRYINNVPTIVDKFLSRRKNM